MFADDTSLFAEHDQEELNRIFEKLEWFQGQSGLQINYDKTVIYRIGSVKDAAAKLYTQKNLAWVNEGVKVLGIFIAGNDEGLLKENFEPLINKTAQILNQWRQRDLTLMGKITIINTLIASLFIHKFTVLPQMPTCYLKRIYNLFSNFIWNHAKPKIALRTLQLNKAEGGLGLANLEIRDQAIKTTWIQMLASDPKSADLAFCNFSPYLWENIFKCNLSPQHTKFVIDKSENPFWFDVLTAWNEYREKKDVNCAFNQTVWYNSNILIGDQPCFILESFKAGLFWISQLYEDKRLISIRKAYEKYKLSFMQFYGLVTAIPQVWRTQLQSDLKPNSSVYSQSLTEKYLAKKVYRELNTSNVAYGNKLVQWSTDPQTPVSIGDFKKQFRDIYSITNIPKFRGFYYRLLHRSLVLNTHLFRWGIKENNLCSFCQKGEESIVHLFVECEEVRYLWHDVFLWLERTFSYTPTWDRESLLWNNPPNNEFPAVRFILLTTQQYVYRQRCRGESLLFHNLKAEIISLRNVEKYLAVKNDKLSVYEKKWSVKIT